MSSAKPLNVFRMELLGAKVESVADRWFSSLKRMRAPWAWVAQIDDTHYVGSTLGPHPFQRLSATIRGVIRREPSANLLSKMQVPCQMLVTTLAGGSMLLGSLSQHER